MPFLSVSFASRVRSGPAAMLIALNKPYRVLSQFSPSDAKRTLAELIDIPGVYPAGRLDYDSEGLLLLTDSGALQHAIAHPRIKLVKTYWAQVEGVPDEKALTALRTGIDLGDCVTRPATARMIAPPANLWPRDPPIRMRQSIPTAWIELRITEGKNRQVRRMTAAVGHPTLRLIRGAIGELSLDDLNLAPGQWCQVDARQLGLSDPGRPATRKGEQPSLLAGQQGETVPDPANPERTPARNRHSDTDQRPIRPPKGRPRPFQRRRQPA